MLLVPRWAWYASGFTAYFIGVFIGYVCWGLQ